MLCSHRRTNKPALMNKPSPVMGHSHKYFRFRFPIFRKTAFCIFACRQKIRELLIFAWLLFGRCFRTSRYSSGYSNLHLSTGILGFQYPTAIFTMAKEHHTLPVDIFLIDNGQTWTEEQLPDSNQIHLISIKIQVEAADLQGAYKKPFTPRTIFSVV